MRLVLANVEPLAIIVGRPPEPVFVDGQEPCIITLAELLQRFRTGLLKDIQVVVPVVALDRFPARVSKIHGRIPLLLYGSRPCVPLFSFEGIELIVSLSSRQMKHQSADGVGIAVDEVVQIGNRQIFGRIDYAVGLTHPGKYGDERSHLRPVSRFRSNDVEIRVGCLSDLWQEESTSQQSGESGCKSG